MKEPVEGSFTDAVDAIRNGDTGQTSAVSEGVIPDDGNTLRNGIISLFFVF